jgi:pilus assembly protein Flp/PilA
MRLPRATKCVATVVEIGAASENLSEAGVMRKALTLLRNLRDNEEGAALIEYTVLLGILVVAVIATIIAVGGWVNGQWSALSVAVGN